MKKLITFIGLIIGANLATAQQKYFTFKIDGKHGITDISGNEVIKPIYKYSKLIPAKGQIYLQDYSDKPDVVFNTATGTKQTYESVYDDQVKIKDVPYTMITNKGKRYLLSEETTKTINLTEEYSDFKNVGEYIIAKYYPKSPPAVSGGKDKFGIPMPPKIQPPSPENMAVLTNDETLKPLMKGAFKSYILLYKVPEEKKEDGLVRVEVINLVDRSQAIANFDYILLSKGNSHTLYNNRMTLVKTFVLAKADEDKLVDASKRIVKQNLASFYGDNGGAPMVISMGPNPVSPSMPSTKPDKEEKPEKKPFKPFFYIKELANGNTLFAYQQTEEISNHIFEAKKGLDISLDKEDHTILVEIDGKEDSKFSFDPKSGNIYLPKIYLKQLGITVL